MFEASRIIDKNHRYKGINFDEKHFVVDVSHVNAPEEITTDLQVYLLTKYQKVLEFYHTL